jgi:predicted metal-dependent hydrolase
MPNKIRTVTYMTTPIEYILTIKKVRNINMRIKPDGIVGVSASRWVSKKSVDEFVISKGKFVLENLEKFKKKESEKPDPAEYVTGEKFELLGTKMNLIVVQEKEEGVYSDGTNIFLCVNDTDDFARKEKLYNRFVDSLCNDIFNRIVVEIYPLFSVHKVSFPTVKIKSMKSRWGSCAHKKGLITLNKNLIEKPRECIEYVVMHEYCHFIHPDHSKRFYNLLGSFLPDWKTRKSLL